MPRKNNIPWNKGLKAETDERVRMNIERASKTFKERGYKPRLGKKHTEETKKKISKTRLERKIPSYWKGKHLSDESKKKISVARKGKALSKSHREKISKGLRKSGRFRPEREYGTTRMVYQEWRKAIFERDKRLCQICLTDEGVLVSHHIVPWKSSISLRFDVSNGIVLCRKCHADLHNFFILTKKAVNSGKLKLLKQLLEALDNPEPSQDGNILEGATTNSRDLRVGNADTSAVNQ